jgi:hypothetical protein
MFDRKPVEPVGEAVVYADSTTPMELKVTTPEGECQLLQALTVDSEMPPREAPIEPEFAIDFVVEPPVISRGACSALIWGVHAPDGLSVELGGVPVDYFGEREVCPAQTTTYELIALGLEEPRSVVQVVEVIGEGEGVPTEAPPPTAAAPGEPAGLPAGEPPTQAPTKPPPTSQPAPTATGPRPIKHAELWMDGALFGVGESANEGGSEPLFASFSFSMPKGVRMLYLRGVDTEGIVGQSLPVTIESAGARERQRLIAIPYGPESSPEQIAAEYGVEPRVVTDKNPCFIRGNRPPTGLLTVPGAPTDETPGEEPGGDTALIPQAGGQGEAAIVPGAALDDHGALFPQLGAQPLPWTLIPPAIGPSAPIDLQGQAQGCLVRLAWPSPTDPDEFRLWMDQQNGIRQLVAKLKPTNPPAERYQYEFEPGIAGLISLTVEAVNPIGAQPSAPVSLSLIATAPRIKAAECTTRPW